MMAFGVMKSLFKKENKIVQTIEFSKKLTIGDLRQFAEQMVTDDLVRVENEYFQDLVLSILSDYDGIIFKGGTAMRMFWNAKRFSADLDFVGNLTEDVLDDLFEKSEFEALIMIDSDVIPHPEAIP